MSRRAEKNGKFSRSGSVKYVRTVKIMLIVFTVAVFPTLMVLTALACNIGGTPRAVYSVIVAALAVVWFTVYGFYAMRVSMGTVTGLETTDKVVHLHTKRKTFTYDVKAGCVAVKVKGNRYLCTFETQDSRDKFIFYRHAPFSKYTDGQFSEEDICAFCPAFAGEDYAKQRGNR